MSKSYKMPIAVEPKESFSEQDYSCDFCGAKQAKHTYIYPGTTKKFYACEEDWCQAGVNLTYRTAWHKIKRVPNLVAFEGISEATCNAFRGQTLSYNERNYWGLSMFTADATIAADFIEAPDGIKVILNNIMGQTARVLIKDLRADNWQIPDADWDRLNANARIWLSAPPPQR